MNKILVCDPTYYGIEYSINPWMSVQNQADRELAIRQWNGLVELLNEIGANVAIMPGQPGLPDMVFTANAGLVFRDQNRVVLSNFKHPERQPEKKHYEAWFNANGFQTMEISSGLFEGAGDALFKEQSSKNDFENKLYLGYGFRSGDDCVSHPDWGLIWNEKTQYIKLIDPYFYHLDTCFCPLKDDYALIWPGAFDKDTVSALETDLELLKVPEEDARKFACNAIAIGNRVIIPANCEATKNLLIGAGFEVFDTDMSEFIKSGGACKCLTLRLE